MNKLILLPLIIVSYITLTGTLHSSEKKIILPEKFTIINEEEPNNYSLDKLFFISSYKNDHLLGTFDGKLVAQYDRIMARVPPNGGEEIDLEFEDVFNSLDHITILEIKTSKTTDYHLFNFLHSNDALILKYDSDKNYLLIKFDGDNKAFEKAEFSNYSISTFKKGEEISIEKGFLIIGDCLYKYNGRTFDKIDVKESFKEYINKASAGKYPQGSMRLLIMGELQLLSKPDLQIMRNEIFARYGYIFKEGGEMDKYFKSQDWYTPQHKNVNDFLTEIEKANLKLIREVEAE